MQSDLASEITTCCFYGGNINWCSHISGQPPEEPEKFTKRGIIFEIAKGQLQMYASRHSRLSGENCAQKKILKLNSLLPSFLGKLQDAKKHSPAYQGICDWKDFKDKELKINGRNASLHIKIEIKKKQN